MWEKNRHVFISLSKQFCIMIKIEFLTVFFIRCFSFYIFSSLTLSAALLSDAFKVQTETYVGTMQGRYPGIIEPTIYLLYIYTVAALWLEPKQTNFTCSCNISSGFVCVRRLWRKDPSHATSSPPYVPSCRLSEVTFRRRNSGADPLWDLLDPDPSP